MAEQDVGLHELIFDDVRRGKLGQAYRRDLRDIYRFFLTGEKPGDDQSILVLRRTGV